MNQIKIDIPIEFKRLFDRDWREAAVWGGRMSLKSHTVARFLLIRARMEKTRVLCAREFQNSIADSSHQLLADLIKHYGLTDFTVTDKAIINTKTGSDFIFKGLWRNEQGIKSIEGIDIAWVEEAQTITNKSLEILTPTIRKEGSQIVYTYNRLNDEDPIHKRLVLEGRPNTLHINVNYDIAIKYGWMPEVLRQEMEDDRVHRPSLYKQKWLGEPTSQEGRIYKDWLEVEEIPHEARLERYGLDFGYTCLVGETNVDVFGGVKKLTDIKIGDYVLTRKGYRKVLHKKKNKDKEVYNIDFGYGRSIIATADHRIYTKNGWKQVSELNTTETICLKQSSLKDLFTEDIHKGKTLITSSGSVKSTEKIYKNDYIEKSIKSITEICLIIWSFIILMATHLITTLEICKQSLHQNTQKFTTHLKDIYHRLVFQKKTGKNEDKKAYTQRNRGLKLANCVKNRLKQLTHIKNSAARFVEKGLTCKNLLKNIFVKSVEFTLRRPAITKGQHVLKNVQITCQKLKEKRTVYDITVEGESEFFANGVLVHNCDPSAIVAICKYNGGYILDEIAYTKGLSNKQIADIILARPRALVVADSAEPKSIDEIASYGVSIVPTVKGKDSVSNGIQLVQSQRISYTRRSHNIRKEYNNYLWRTDRYSGAYLNEPEHTFSHGMDAIRYALTDLIKNDTYDDTDDDKIFGDYRMRDV